MSLYKPHHHHHSLNLQLLYALLSIPSTPYTHTHTHLYSSLLLFSGIASPILPSFCASLFPPFLLGFPPYYTRYLSTPSPCPLPSFLQCLPYPLPLLLLSLSLSFPIPPLLFPSSLCHTPSLALCVWVYLRRQHLTLKTSCKVKIRQSA